MFCDDNSYLPVIVNLLKVMKFKVMFYNHHYRKLSGDYRFFAGGCFKSVMSFNYFYLSLTLQVLTGIGFAVCVSCVFHSMASLGVITWSCQAFYYLFTQQEFPEKRIRFFEDRVLDKGEATLGDLGLLHGQLALCLGIACIVVFIFVAAGTKSLGKVGSLAP